MTVVLRQREPLDLHQVDDNSCLTCVTANVLYVLGVTDTLDTRWVDREVGREPGCGAQRAGARRFLLQQGPEICPPGEGMLVWTALRLLM